MDYLYIGVLFLILLLAGRILIGWWLGYDESETEPDSE